jgi:hypothetical protein
MRAGHTPGNDGTREAPSDAAESQATDFKRQQPREREPMSNTSGVAADDALLTTLNGIPPVDFPANVRAAMTAGRRMTSILADVVSLRRGPGQLVPAEFFYYRLWEPRLTREAKQQFVGKQAQHPMHIACNNTGWYAAAADKLLFQTLMTGAGFPGPELLAVTAPGRRVPGGRVLRDQAEIDGFLRDPANYPLFAKPIDGKYSISVVSADAFDVAANSVMLQGGDLVTAEDLAVTLASREAGYIVQRRMKAHPRLAALFGPPLWSVRVLVLLTATGPIIHRAVAKIATGRNPADNFWRRGNMIGAIDLTTGQITRVVRGTGANMTVNPVHPDTGRAIIGTVIPEWDRLAALAKEASRLLPAIRTQSWDIAVTDEGPIPLEVNFGGDLNLAQLASGAGVLDEAYRSHLTSCGYKGLASPGRQRR